jgi:predicted RNA-binding Zn ribbon-like protein
VQAFINTHFDLGADFGSEVLHSPDALGGWWKDAGLIANGTAFGDHDLTVAIAVRESLRALAAVEPGRRKAQRRALERLDWLAAGSRVEVRFTASGPDFLPVPEAGARGAIGCLLAMTGQAMADGSWSRLKICPGDHCGWAFYDHSRNRTGRWCSMSVCGGRAKAKSHYRRRRAQPR